MTDFYCPSCKTSWNGRYNTTHRCDTCNTPVRVKTAAPGATWISVEDRLPVPLDLVLLRHHTGFGNNAITVIGKWVPALTDESTAEDEEWVEYDEKTDTYYVPEGWYEFQANWDEYSAIHINEAVTHWMPLPAPPGGDR